MLQFLKKNKKKLLLVLIIIYAIFFILGGLRTYNFVNGLSNIFYRLLNVIILILIYNKKKKGVLAFLIIDVIVFTLLNLLNNFYLIFSYPVYMFLVLFHIFFKVITLILYYKFKDEGSWDKVLFVLYTLYLVFELIYYKDIPFFDIFINFINLAYIYFVLDCLKSKDDSNVNENYSNIAAQFILSVLTFGIWNCICFYRVLKYVYKTDCSTKMFLYIVVPFYKIYLVNQVSKRIDKMCLQYQIESNICTVSTVLSIFFTIIPTLIIQDKINDIECLDKSKTSIVNNDDTYIQLAKYKKMLDDGLITEEDYNNLKNKIIF